MKRTLSPHSVFSVPPPFTTDNNDSWRRMRRATHEALNKGRLAEYRPLHEKEAVLLIDGILRNPAGWEGE